MAEINLQKCLDWLETLEDPGDDYIVGAIVGEGNAGVVHEGIDSDGKRVAFKIIEEQGDNIEDIYEEHAILRESCTGNLRFPTFFRAYRKALVSPKQIWFVMELCELGSMQDVLCKLKPKDRVLQEDILSYILHEVAQALKDLHDQSIIHRDVKAANILITQDGNIKLTDFSLSRHVGTPDGKLQSSAGSPFWMAPEVTVAERSPDLAYDSRADVWSLGITAVELADGVAPLSDVFPPRALDQIIQNPPPTLRKPSEWSQLFNDFIAECLVKTWDHRPWSAEIVEHPFLQQKPDKLDDIRFSIRSMLEEIRDDCPASQPSEVTVKSNRIKMSRKESPQLLSRDDLATLSKVSEHAVMETLQERFAQGNIYTYLGDILLVINPFGQERFKHLYTPEVAMKYKYKARCDNAPHIYGVADRAYQDMLHHQEIQNIILTGETASGKTTAGKHVMWHLTNMSTASTKNMIERILKVQTLVFAFAHARTIFNENATRCVQYHELTFTTSGKLSGGIVSLYCLEKYRVTTANKHQSNFYIFYYLLDGLRALDQTRKYHLSQASTYDYLPTYPRNLPKMNAEKFGEVQEAFNILDFSLEEQDSIFKILATILLLGQVRISGEDHATIANPEVVERISSLLDVDTKKLAWTFTNFCVVVHGESVRGKSSPREALEVRDSFARSLYTRLVDWIVNLVNKKLLFTRIAFGDQLSMGILDIPGFECFAQDNKLDQFIVNMANEQLQYLYNQRLFLWEMEDYKAEDMSIIPYNFHDNGELLNLVMSRPVGLLAYLDETTITNIEDHECFLSQLESGLASRFISKLNSSTFSVAHYSGQVVYDAENFVERNKNFLSPELIQVMRGSDNPIIIQLFTNTMTKTGHLTIGDEDMRFNTKSKGKFSQLRQMQTAASTVRQSLLELLKKVGAGSAHFVRCIRSNLSRESMTFDRDLVRYQIRALGVRDSILARQLGYSRRLGFAEFLKRYKFLAFDFDETVEDTRDNCRLLLIRLKMEGWALGNSKVFLKYYNEEFLSRLYETQVHKIIKIQSMMRAFLVRKKTLTSKVSAPHQALLRQAKKQGPTKLSIGGTGTTPILYEVKEPRSPGYYEVYSSKSNGTNTGGSTPIKSAPIATTLERSPVHGASVSCVNTGNTIEGGICQDKFPSPREIAKAFEATARENQKTCPLAGRCLPGNGTSPRGTMSLPINAAAGRIMSPNDNNLIPGKLTPPRMGSNQSSPRHQGPEIINPLEEFTNMVKKMGTSSSGGDKGPYNFQAMLRKTKPDVEATPRRPTSLNVSVTGNNVTPNSSASSTRPETASESKENVNGKVILLPGLVIEGVCEDL